MFGQVLKNVVIGVDVVCNWIPQWKRKWNWKFCSKQTKCLLESDKSSEGYLMILSFKLNIFGFGQSIECLFEQNYCNICDESDSKQHFLDILIFLEGLDPKTIQILSFVLRFWIWDQFYIKLNTIFENVTDIDRVGAEGQECKSIQGNASECKWMSLMSVFWVHFIYISPIDCEPNKYNRYYKNLCIGLTLA